MTHRHHERARKVVAVFKELIGESACSQIKEVHFEDLNLMICEAISEEMRDAAELVDKVAQHLRSESDIHEFGL